ncbi:hypothetical protein L6R52_42685, partial [Myxococcota bacterium]|nr:hypothetical protein [Myxococcota bacterium]
ELPDAAPPEAAAPARASAMSPGATSLLDELRTFPLPGAVASSPSDPIIEPVEDTPEAHAAPSAAPIAEHDAPAPLVDGELPETVMFGDAGPSTADLIRPRRSEPTSGDAPEERSVEPGFYAGPGARARLVLRDRAYLKSSVIVAASGALELAPLTPDRPGAAPVGDPDDPICTLDGRAVLLLRVPRMAVALRGVHDLHAVASNVVGFDAGFAWAESHVAGLDVLTLIGSGSVLLDTRGPPMLIPVDAETPVHAARAAILGWSDGVRPSPVGGGNGDARLFRLRGRGYVLVAFPPEAPVGPGQGRGP